MTRKIVGIERHESSEGKALKEMSPDECRVLDELAASMGIPESPGRMQQTLLELARIYVPGLKASSRHGAPRKWDPFTTDLLVKEIGQLMHNEGLNKIRACNRVAKQLAKSGSLLSKCVGTPSGDALARQCSSKELKRMRSKLKNPENYIPGIGFAPEIYEWKLALKQKTERNFA
jgi:hypothetical protein